jgi:hypothetical protein
MMAMFALLSRLHISLRYIVREYSESRYVCGNNRGPNIDHGIILVFDVFRRFRQCREILDQGFKQTIFLRYRSFILFSIFRYYL